MMASTIILDPYQSDSHLNLKSHLFLWILGALNWKIRKEQMTHPCCLFKTCPAQPGPELYASYMFLLADSYSLQTHLQDLLYNRNVFKESAQCYVLT